MLDLVAELVMRPGAVAVPLPWLPGLALLLSLPVLLGEGVPVGWVGVSGSHVPAAHGGEWGEQQGWKEGKGSAVLYPACCSRLPLFPS